MLSLTDVNIDVLDIIFSFLDTSSTAALVRTSHHLYALALPFLFTHVSLDRDAAQVLEFCYSINRPSNGPVGDSVLSLSIGAEGFYLKESIMQDGRLVTMKSEEAMPELFAQDLADAIERMPRLTSFTCSDCTDELLFEEPRVGSALLGRPLLSYIRLNGLDDSSSTMIENLRGMRAVHFSPSWRSTLNTALGVPLSPTSGIGKVIYNSQQTLQELSLPRSWLRNLISPTNNQQPVWPNVHTLNLPHSYANASLLGQAFPNILHLSGLQLRDDNSRDTPDFKDANIHPRLRSVEGHYPMVRAICQGRSLHRIYITSAGGARLQNGEATKNANDNALWNFLDMVRGPQTRSLKFDVLGDVPVSFFQNLASSTPNLVFLELMIGDNWKTEGHSLPKLFQIIPVLSCLPLGYISIKYHPFESRLAPQRFTSTSTATHRHTLEALVERLHNVLPALRYIQISSWAVHWGKTWWKVLEGERNRTKSAVTIEEEEGYRARQRYDWSGVKFDFDTASTRTIGLNRDNSSSRSNTTDLIR